ncbi:MAG: hypothetical protein CRN43_18115 [Candidatus Nephrothrix sp. EaCA]|nr:MAG: hypothetical protein CRN43_18115 [Candidatus Nephrothrix sp. EaCA]
MGAQDEMASDEKIKNLVAAFLIALVFCEWQRGSVRLLKIYCAGFGKFNQDLGGFQIFLIRS